MNTGIRVVRIPTEQVYNSDGKIGGDELTERLFEADVIIDNIISMNLIKDQIIIFYKK